jgi:hypothetical protein
MAFFVINLIPLLIIFLIYRCVVDCLRKRSNVALQRLERRSYSLDVVVEGDPECRICMVPYAEGEDVTALPCSDKHHFHSDCIARWLEITPNCPICRTDFDMNQGELLLFIN